VVSPSATCPLTACVGLNIGSLRNTAQQQGVCMLHPPPVTRLESRCPLRKQFNQSTDERARLQSTGCVSTGMTWQAADHSATLTVCFTHD